MALAFCQHPMAELFPEMLKGGRQADSSECATCILGKRGIYLVSGYHTLLFSLLQFPGEGRGLLRDRVASHRVFTARPFESATVT